MASGAGGFLQWAISSWNVLCKNISERSEEYDR